MWYFTSPKIVFGEDALSHLEQLKGQRAFIVTDANLARLGFAERVQARLAVAGIESTVFADVEPEPSLQMVRRCAQAMAEYAPDWVVGLGGGSSLDAAKGAWFLYERPDVDPAAINPFEDFGLRNRARLIAIPTTSGTGADVTMAAVLTDQDEGRKLGLGSHELVPDIAIVDPSLVGALPAQLTADTGLDALTHAIEGYTCAFRNDFADGLCLKAIQLIFTYLPRAYADGSDGEAREHMHNAATIAGLGFGNAMAGLAHAMGHALGAVFHIPHGRSVALMLPYTVQFTASVGEERYAEIARFLGLPGAHEDPGPATLLAALEGLMRSVHQPLAISDLAITPEDFEAGLPHLIANAESDTSLVTGARIPNGAELEQLFRHAYEGWKVEF